MRKGRPPRLWLLALAAVPLAVHGLSGCHRQPAVGDRDQGGWDPRFAEPTIGIDVEERGDRVALLFKFCDGGGQPFVDRLVVTKISPSDEAGRMCEFESETEGGELRGTWLYGEARRGVGRCWPLTEGTYSVVAIGSGTGQTNFSLNKKWFGRGFASKVLTGGCRT